MAGEARGEDIALGDFQRGKQGRGAMPLVIMGYRPTPALLAALALGFGPT